MPRQLLQPLPRRRADGGDAGLELGQHRLPGGILTAAASEPARYGAGGRSAPEIRDLLDQLPATPAPDPVALAHWLAGGGPPGDRTLYAGVRRLARRAWTPEYVEPELGSRGEHAARWREALKAAVARCATDRAAVLLSGGLDSGAVAAVLAPGERRAYSAVFPDHPEIDESALIAELAEALGLRSVRAVVRSASVLSGALPYLQRWGVPPVSPNLSFWDPLLARVAADGADVILDGEGGDQLFGLSPQLVADRLAGRDVLGALSLVYQAPGALGRPSRRSVARYVRQAGLRPLAPAWAHAASRRLRPAERYAPSWFGPALARAYAGSLDGAAYKRFDGPRWWAAKVAAVLEGDSGPIIEDHLRHRAAAVGVEARHPWLDRALVETVLATPPELSFDPFVSRPLLREAVAGLLPERVRTRPDKSGFDALFHAALAGPDLPLLRGLAGAADARVNAYVDRARVAELLAAPRPHSDWAMPAWRILTAEIWLRWLEDPGALRRDAEAIGVPAPGVSIEG